MSDHPDIEACAFEDVFEMAAAAKKDGLTVKSRTDAQWFRCDEIGMICLWEPGNRSSTKRISHWWVHPDHRGDGIGTVLFEYALEAALESDAETLDIYIYDPEFLEPYGFKEQPESSQAMDDARYFVRDLTDNSTDELPRQSPMTNEQDTDHEQWEAIGAQTEQAQDQLNELFNELAENVPEDMWREQFNQINFGLSDLKLTLEGRIETERPDSDISDVFHDSEPALSNEEEENEIRELAHEYLGENVQVVQSTPRSLKIMFSGASTSKIDQFRAELHQRGYATARPVNRLITVTQGSLETLSSEW